MLEFFLNKKYGLFMVEVVEEMLVILDVYGVIVIIVFVGFWVFLGGI